MNNHHSLPLTPQHLLICVALRTTVTAVSCFISEFLFLDSSCSKGSGGRGKGSMNLESQNEESPYFPSLVEPDMGRDLEKDK